LAIEEQEQFVVVINAEEQYSIWPEYYAVAAGWMRIATFVANERPPAVRATRCGARPAPLRDAHRVIPLTGHLPSLPRRLQPERLSRFEQR
jgi:hypothetical protein